MDTNRSVASYLSRGVLATMAMGLPCPCPSPRPRSPRAVRPLPAARSTVTPADDVAAAINCVAPGGTVILGNGSFAAIWLDNRAVKNVDLGGVTCRSIRE